MTVVDPGKRTRASVGEPLAWLRDKLANADRSRCWEWPFNRSQKDYGFVKLDGIQLHAHAVALILDGHPRPLPPNDHALHDCDNPSCVNPSHCRWGSNIDSVRDRVSRGRTRAKLTAADVVAIRKDRRTSTAIAAEYGVSHSLVSMVKRRHRWKHVR